MTIAPRRKRAAGGIARGSSEPLRERDSCRATSDADEGAGPDPFQEPCHQPIQFGRQFSALLRGSGHRCVRAAREHLSERRAGKRQLANGHFIEHQAKGETGRLARSGSRPSTCSGAM